MSEDWLDSLEPTQRAKAHRMIQRMTELGTPDPQEWVQSEIEENIPQMASFLVLRNLWREIDAWRDQNTWMPQMVTESEENPHGFFADAGIALKRMQESGISMNDVGCVARFVAYSTTFSVLNRIDEGCDPEAAEDVPGWVLAETNSEGEGTGRVIAGLHESILLLDPSGREGKAV